MKVLYTCDDNYAWLMGISMISLLENNRSMKELEIYLLGSNISEGNKKYIYDIALKYNRNIYLMDIPELKNFPQNIHLHRWPLSACIRLFAGELLPEEIDKILYIDCDTVIQEGVNELDEVDISEKTFLGVRDCISGRYKKNIGMGKHDIYINAGVLLINLKKLREVDVGQRIDNFVKRYGASITYADQDILNGVFGREIASLPLRYNMMTIVEEYNHKELCLLRRPADFYSETEMKEAVDRPVIIHYTTNMRTIRPWYRNTNHPCRELFRKYLAMSPWAEKKLEWMEDKRADLRLIGVMEKLPRWFFCLTLGIVHAWIRPAIRSCRLTARKRRI